ncbi:MAG TPA: potassium/proton antiporter [Alphaproteobacteria bacterium]|nr:potassium/proton antiporter [Alphaproteobacteria bacterium]
MELANQFILLGGALLVISILAGVASSRIGAPLLLVFLGLGMLAGENGPLGIPFDDFKSAYLIASVSLAIILFDGGLRTPLAALRISWLPASLLATLGVLVTAGVTGVCARYVFGLGWLNAFLMGATVASTDAAAVFLLLHQHGMDLKRRVATTLEIESGANDPLAVLLTVLLVGIIAAGGSRSSWEVEGEFLRQVGLGTALGVAGGGALVWALNRLELAPGLYPVFVAAGALVVFGGTQALGGSGFLAIYLAGIIAGNQRLRANKLVRRFHDGIAWVAQIVMFVMLGLLVTPRELVPDLVPATIVALALIFVARPVAVFLCLAFSRFNWEERLFIAWVGLRGAVPLFLAIIPILGGVPDAHRYFNVAFIVVLASLLLQGWTVPWIARRLEVEVPPMPEPLGRMEIDLPSQMDREVVGYTVRSDSPIAKRPLDRIALPKRTRLLAVIRDRSVIPLRELGELQPGDSALLICPPEHALAVDRLFLPRRRQRSTRAEVQLADFVFRADAPVGSIAHEYDFPATREELAMSLGRFVESRLDEQPSVGDTVAAGAVELVVTDMDGEEIVTVGVRLEHAHLHILPEALVRRLTGTRRRLGRSIARSLRR